MNFKKYRLCMIFLAVLCFLFNSISIAYSEQNKTVQIIDENSIIFNTYEEETFNLINNIRKENGLPELKQNAKLQALAKLKAEDIINNEYFSHTSPTYGTPFEMMSSYGLDYKAAGENLAGNITPEKAVEAWMNSDSHRANILDNNFEYMAICIVDSEIYGKVFVQMFIKLTGID